MANIRAYLSGSSAASSGDYSAPIDCGTCYIGGSESSARSFTVKTDTAGYTRAGNYTISLIGTYANRYRLSTTSAGLSGATYGGSVTLTGGINSTGTTVWLQKRAIIGDTLGATSTRAQISLPQDSITSG